MFVIQQFSNQKPYAINSFQHLRLSGQDKNKHILYLDGVLKTRKSLPPIWEKFNNVLNMSYTDLACHNSDYKKSKKL